MGLEIEAKMKVADHDALRRRLRELGATLAGAHLETNTFFDTLQDLLRASGKGLRLRINRNLADGAEQAVITFKGPLEPGPFKTRREIELVADDAVAARELFEALGFAAVCSFEKKRESWQLGSCKVELDELPYLGKFVEIEGPSEAAVVEGRKILDLSQPTIQTAYITLLLEHLQRLGISDRRITFPQPAAPRP